jgi:hypothetical protein
MLISVRARIGLLALSLGALALAGCNKKEEAPQAVPMPSAPEPVKAAPDPQPTGGAANPGAAAGSATEAPAGPAAVAPTASAEAPKPTGGGASIDGCCSALAGIQKSGLPANVKAKAGSAASTCASISKLVKEGKTSRASALAQVRATMGGSAPSECN